MTDQEYAEAQRLQAEIDHLIMRIREEEHRRDMLIAELQYIEVNVPILENNARVMGQDVNGFMTELQGQVRKVELEVSDLFYALDDLVRVYTGFKAMSTASKNMSQYTDEYYTKYQFYNRLRRITLGYVIGLDANIISSETLRKQVEKNYLQNTDYWLSYAIMAVMLWANNEEEAAKRALNKAVQMNYFKSSVFFMLINLRFGRIEAARKWFLIYLDRVDVDDLSDEWQYMLQGYLSGVFGADEKFNALAKEQLTGLLLQMQSNHPNYGREVAGYVTTFTTNYSYVTRMEFENLRRYCTEYSELQDLLSLAEKNQEMIAYIRNVWDQEDDVTENYSERVENILYNLINDYDDHELELWKKIRYNEHVLRNRGDVQKAQIGYNAEFPAEGKKTTLAEKLFQWAFQINTKHVDAKVKRFSLDFLKKWITKGYEDYGHSYRGREKSHYHMQIDNWEMDCSENSEREAVSSISSHFSKNHLRNLLADNLVIIFIVMLAVSAVTLLITILHFSPFLLVTGILVGMVGGFLLWRRIVNLNQILYRKRNKAIAAIQSTLRELAAWRAAYKKADEMNKDLVSIFDSLNL